MIIVNQGKDPIAKEDNLLIELPYSSTPSPINRLAVGCYYPYKNTQTGQYGWQSLMTVLTPSIQKLITNGSVSSVGLSMPSELLVTNSPITSSGILTVAWASQAGNKILASPNGASGIPSFRSFANADLPTSGVAAGTYMSANITVNDKGIITAASGGATWNVLIDGGTFLAPNENTLIDAGSFV